MSTLKSLTFAALPKPGRNPTLDRRNNVVGRLEEQKLLLADPNYIRKSQRWTKKDGDVAVERQQRVTPWWRADASGAYLLFIRSGGKQVEFEKGKMAIAVPLKDKLPGVIDTLITAVRSGELDDQLAQTSKKPPTKAKKAA